MDTNAARKNQRSYNNLSKILERSGVLLPLLGVKADAFIFASVGP